MGDVSSLQLLWFALIGVLFSGFFFLEGFDFGVGMSTRFLAKNRAERDQIVHTIGPVWDGNEVWLLTAGGAMFASFPGWYAAVFSGYYLILFAILFGLIIRGVSFEFREKMDTQKGRNFWDWTLFIGSLLPPFFFGLLFTSMVQGMPLDADGNMMATFTDYFTPFSIVGAVAVTLLCLLHGLNYIRLKTAGDIRVRAEKMAQKLYILLFVGLVAFAGLMYVSTDFFTVHPVSTLILLVVIIVLSVLATFGAYKGKEWLSFLTSGLTLMAVVALLFFGLFPRVMVGQESIYDLLIVNASSSPYTLKLMTWISLSILPFVLAYQGWTYYIFRKRVKKEDVVGGH
ncbi:cytochrome d ubiquinol oxidase subunit II [Isobaculum melis]|uniref:Cytochrome bd-I ubiquinol oxidase subunit 2 apoprotein n=1 Tax=Isobaculum melis TaxID=142588 RepID=A0A1H9TKU1_9LACT|nr:cytochrome d ubiquinol oxidase subunit II [Isobaculum melis]SER97529.1 cytochrome bd-I ubiquinol oxidase subunit 2 apoprotein [Isobaculum melis]